MEKDLELYLEEMIRIKVKTWVKNENDKMTKWQNDRWSITLSLHSKKLKWVKTYDSYERKKKTKY